MKKGVCVSGTGPMTGPCEAAPQLCPLAWPCRVLKKGALLPEGGEEAIVGNR